MFATKNIGEKSRRKLMGVLKNCLKKNGFLLIKNRKASHAINILKIVIMDCSLMIDTETG